MHLVVRLLDFIHQNIAFTTTIATTAIIRACLTSLELLHQNYSEFDFPLLEPRRAIHSSSNRTRSNVFLTTDRRQIEIMEPSPKSSPSPEFSPLSEPTDEARIIAMTSEEQRDYETPRILPENSVQRFSEDQDMNISKKVKRLEEKVEDLELDFSHVHDIANSMAQGKIPDVDDYDEDSLARVVVDALAKFAIKARGATTGISAPASSSSNVNALSTSILSLPTNSTGLSSSMRAISTRIGMPNAPLPSAVSATGIRFLRTLIALTIDPRGTKPRLVHAQVLIESEVCVTNDGLSKYYGLQARCYDDAERAVRTLQQSGSNQDEKKYEYLQCIQRRGCQIVLQTTASNPSVFAVDGTFNVVAWLKALHSSSSNMLPITEKAYCYVFVRAQKVFFNPVIEQKHGVSIATNRNTNAGIPMNHPAIAAPPTQANNSSTSSGPILPMMYGPATTFMLGPQPTTFTSALAAMSRPTSSAASSVPQSASSQPTPTASAAQPAVHTMTTAASTSEDVEMDEAS